MQDTSTEKLQKIAAELVAKMGFEAKIEIVADPLEEETYQVALEVNEGQHFLIGQKGANLAAFQHLLRALYRKNETEAKNVTVDINRYVQEKRDLLIHDVEKAVKEALENNISVALRPMLPYERKMVHTYLAKHPRVTTESAGSGPNRKVMVRPKISSDDVSEEVL